jgi:hypothetical protein
MVDLVSVPALIIAQWLVCQYDRCLDMSSQIRCRAAAHGTSERLRWSTAQDQFIQQGIKGR